MRTVKIILKIGRRRYKGVKLCCENPTCVVDENPAWTRAIMRAMQTIPSPTTRKIKKV